MEESEHNRIRHEFNICKNDDHLRTHLESRIARGFEPNIPLFTCALLQKAGQIRLLTLLPGSLGDEIRCTLHTYDSVSAPDYVALSYVWGDKTRTLPIQCDQCRTMIAIKLYSALLRIRKPDVEVVLWVDALCINQADDVAALQERARQVRMMDRIFRQAQHVVIDLGGGSEQECQEFHKYYEEFLNKMRQPDLHISSMFPDLSHPFWTSFRRFIRRPWFTRVWIVQEFVVAQKATMLLGNRELDPMKLWFLTKMAQAFHSSRMSNTEEVAPLLLTGRFTGFSQEDAYHIRNYTYMWNCHLMYQQGEKPPLRDLLDVSRDMAVTDVRDHVFALAGLSADWDSLEVEVDYTKSVSEVRASVARSLIKQGHLFHCLSHAAGITEWALTWAPLLQNPQYPRRGGRPENFSMNFYHRIYHAAGGLNLEASVVDGTFLMIRGFCIDIIQTIAPVFPLHYHHLKKPKLGLPAASLNGVKALEWYVSIRRWTRSILADLDACAARDTLWRAITWDSISVTSIEKRRAPIETLRNKFRILEDMIRSSYSDTMPDRAEAESHHQDNRSMLSDDLVDTWSLCRESRLCSTDAGRIINTPQKTVHGNEIWILFGIPLPMVLRHLGRQKYAVVGPAFVEGLMDGEALELSIRRDESIYLS